MAVPTFSSPFLPLVSKLLRQKVSNCSQVSLPSPKTLCEGKADWLGGVEFGEEIGEKRERKFALIKVKNRY